MNYQEIFHIFSMLDLSKLFNNLLYAQYTSNKDNFFNQSNLNLHLNSIKEIYLN